MYVTKLPPLGEPTVSLIIFHFWPDGLAVSTEPNTCIFCPLVDILAKVVYIRFVSVGLAFTEVWYILPVDVPCSPNDVLLSITPSILIKLCTPAGEPPTGWILRYTCTRYTPGSKMTYSNSFVSAIISKSVGTSLVMFFWTTHRGLNALLIQREFLMNKPVVLMAAEGYVPVSQVVPGLLLE